MQPIHTVDARNLAAVGVTICIVNSLGMDIQHIASLADFSPLKITTRELLMHCQQGEISHFHSVFLWSDMVDMYEPNTFSNKDKSG